MRIFTLFSALAVAASLGLAGCEPADGAGAGTGTETTGAGSGIGSGTGSGTATGGTSPSTDGGDATTP